LPALKPILLPSDILTRLFVSLLSVLLVMLFDIFGFRHVFYVAAGPYCLPPSAINKLKMFPAFVGNQACRGWIGGWQLAAVLP